MEADLDQGWTKIKRFWQRRISISQATTRQLRFPQLARSTVNTTVVRFGRVQGPSGAVLVSKHCKTILGLESI